MQVHSEYVMYAHFELLRRLIGHTEKIRFFLDLDSGIRGACLSAWRSGRSRPRAASFASDTDYSPYDPGVLAQVLAIYRVFYNYIAVGRDKQTPAMRLGLAEAPLTAQDLVFFSRLTNLIGGRTVVSRSSSATRVLTVMYGATAISSRAVHSYLHLPPAILAPGYPWYLARLYEAGRCPSNDCRPGCVCDRPRRSHTRVRHPVRPPKGVDTCGENDHDLWAVQCGWPNAWASSEFISTLTQPFSS